MRAAESLAGMTYPLARYLNVGRLVMDRLKFVEALARCPGDIVRAPVSRTVLYLVREPEMIKEVLINQARKVIKARGLQRSKYVLGEGLLTSEGEVHLRQRRLSQPAFHRQRLQNYGAAMVEFTARHRARLRPGEEVDLHQELMRLTLAVVGKTLFDSDIEGEAAYVGKALHDFFEAFPLMVIPGSERIEHLPLPRLKRSYASIKELDRIISDMIAARRREVEAGTDRGDLLSMLIAAQDTETDGGGMSDRQVRDECMTLMLAGHETTANALTWTYYLLSQHPEVEAKLHHELDTVLGDRLPTAEDFPRLPYCEKVLAESIRLYPPAWMMVRQVVEPLQLGRYTLLPGEVIGISPWVMHHDARYFPDPERFDPERFTPEAKASRPRFSYLPFSAGPRNCIGEHFAWLEGVLILATLSQRFRFELASGKRVEPLAQITLRPKHGMRMRVHLRG